MVTAEMAIGLPALMAVLVLAISTLAAVGAQLRCVDAAAGAARLAARGEPAELVRQFVAADGPAGATPTVSTGEGRVTVTVATRLRLPVVGGLLPVRLSATTSQPVEPGVESTDG